MDKKTSTPRITMQTIWTHIFSVFNLERGLGYTMWQLTIRPGAAIREFLFTERRKKHIKPISFLILLVSVSTYFTIKMLPESAEVLNDKLANSSSYIALFIKDFGDFLFKYFNLIQMLKIPFLSIGTFYFFKKNKFNFAEHLVINSYIFSYISFFFALILMISKFFSLQILWVILVMNIIYPCFVYFKLFKEPVLWTFVKFLGIFWLASILHFVFIIGVGAIWQQIGV